MKKWNAALLGSKTVAILMVLTAILIFGGCTAGNDGNSHESVNSNIHAKGIVLGMAESKLFEELGQVEKENCVYGSECVFEDKKLVIGLDFDGKVRRIRIEDPTDDIYGIKPGMTLDEAKRIAVDAGYVNVDGTKKYVKDGIVLELLSLKNTLADKIIIEVEPKN